MSETRTFNFDELALCAERELRFRRRVYRQMVADEKMSQATADREIAMMLAIFDHFRNLSEPQLL